MIGQVVGVNGDRCAVQVTGGITIFECLETHSTELGDVIIGDLESVGRKTVVNETKDERISVIIEDYGRTSDGARSFLYP